MQLTRVLPVLGGLALAVAVACSDSSPTAPDAPRTTVGTTGKADTGKSQPPTTSPTSPKPDSQATSPTNPTPPTTGPDTAGAAKPSNDPRVIAGVVLGMGPAGDSASYQKIAGATVTWTAFDGKELARATTGADGSFSLGSYVPASYMFKVTPPANSPYKGVEWAFIVSPYSSAKLDLMVVLGRK